MNLLAYGSEAPGPEDRPLKCRSSTLEQVKKGISFFMPHKIAPWNVETSYGNPTRSVAVNNVIKYVRKHEVHKEGRPSRAKRDIKRNEFVLTMRILEGSNGELLL